MHKRTTWYSASSCVEPRKHTIVAASRAREGLNFPCSSKPRTHAEAPRKREPAIRHTAAGVTNLFAHLRQRYRASAAVVSAAYACRNGITVITHFIHQSILATNRRHHTVRRACAPHTFEGDPSCSLPTDSLKYWPQWGNRRVYPLRGRGDLEAGGDESREEDAYRRNHTVHVPVEP